MDMDVDTAEPKVSGRRGSRKRGRGGRGRKLQETAFETGEVR
jgi:hypothetical protein